MGTNRMYDELAEWWPLLSTPSDYAEEAAFYTVHLRGACTRPPRTMLELGSGGGNNASFMKQEVDAVTLVDLSPAMLAVSRRLNPDCEHLQGDMRSVRLGRQFDCVFVHDAVTYMTSEDDLRAAMETAFLHCAPGGGVLFAPDHLKETFRPSTGHGGHDADPADAGGDGRAMRYLAWSWDPDPSDTTVTTHYVLVLREAGGEVRTVEERHLEGLFPRATWMRLLEQAGFTDVRAVPFDHSELEPGDYELFVGTRPA